MVGRLDDYWSCCPICLLPNEEGIKMADIQKAQEIVKKARLLFISRGRRAYTLSTHDYFELLEALDFQEVKKNYHNQNHIIYGGQEEC
jgi:hypothetical protein